MVFRLQYIEVAYPTQKKIKAITYDYCHFVIHILKYEYSQRGG